MEGRKEKAKNELKFSLSDLDPRYQKKYKFLCAYSFFWWGFYSLYVIFQPLYLVHQVKMPLWAVFLNGAIESIVTIVVASKWSDLADKTGNLRLFLLVGNVVMASVSFLILSVENLWSLFMLSILFRASPSPDVFSTIYVYQLSDYHNLSGSESNPILDLKPVERKFRQINTFAKYRRFGSIGWALVAPFGGWLCNLYGIGLNFAIAGVGFLTLSIIAYYKLDRGPKYSKTPSKNQFGPASINLGGEINSIGDYRRDEIQGKNASYLEAKPKTYWDSIKGLFTNKIFVAVLVSSLLYSVAEAVTYSTQGIFYGILTDNNYVLIALAYSIAAFIEWPVMTLIAKHLGKYGWTSVVSATYAMAAARQGFIALVAIFRGGILWVYLIQMFRGVIFGSYLPTITFGIYSSMKKSPNLSLSFHRSIKIVGALMGNLFGALLSWLIADEVNMFVALFVMALILSLMAGFVLETKAKNHNKNKHKLDVQ